MGIDYYTARLLLKARASGVSFASTLTIGRQNLFVSEPRLRKLGEEFHFPADEVLRCAEQNGGYVEPFLQIALGAQEVTSIDASSYENATIVHDLNQPVSDDFRRRFDAVIEAGSLEHIFNFPVAIANLMDGVKLGGKLFIQTPANNYFGHGFYQFSPELYYRVLSPENGFRIDSLCVVEHLFPAFFLRTRTYKVTDPAKIKERVQLLTNCPVLMLIEASRAEYKEIFPRAPQQSDYLQTWHAGAVPPAPGPFKKQLLSWVERLPIGLAESLWLQRFLGGGKPSLRNPRFFEIERP
jgi:hypothetical protein